MIRVFGITGTNGKTTASWMLRSILQQKYTCGMIGTVEHNVGGRRYVPVNTTPGREMLSGLFSQMTERGTECCVMEVSSHGLAQNRTDNVKFEGTGFTNLSRDHLDYHRSMEEYFEVKSRLFLSEKVNSAVNIDDPYGRRLYDQLTGMYGTSNVKSYSMLDRNADLFGKIESEDLSGTEVMLYRCGEPAGRIKVKIPGRQFAYDALLAALMAVQAGIEPEYIAEGIGKTDRVPGRMQFIGSRDDTLGIVDYAHTPDSLEKLLQSVADLKRGKLICVFGCGGFRDRGKRRIMGSIAGKYSDYCIITSDNPRGEPPENITQAIEEGLHPTGCGYCVIIDRYHAIKRAVSLSDKWDIIVVAGKGHETWQESAGECTPFDDRKVLKELLEMKYEKTYDETD